MPLFRNSNKSQASLDRHTDSRDRSPVQPEPAYPQAQAYGGSQPASQHLQLQDAATEERYYRDQKSSAVLPAQHQIRVSTTSRGPAGAVDAYASARDQVHQPTVNVVPPLSPSAPIHQQVHHIPGQPNIIQFPSTRIDPPTKKSRRGLFGLGSSKDKKEPREHAGVGKTVNRTSSVLKKTSHHPQQPPTPSTAQSPQSVNAGQFSSAEPSRSNQYAQESPAEPLTDDPERYEEYYRARGQSDGPPDQDTHQGIRYVAPSASYDEPVTPRHNKQLSLQRVDYPSYHQNSSANNSSTYLPHPQPQTAAHNPLRPPSQQSLSLGPPSPIGGQHSDSRPPTAGAQGRYSTSTGQPQQLEQSQDHPRQDRDESGNMGRNDGSNGNVRQHRDDERHPMYQSQQDPRIRTQGHDQGRSTPPLSNREDLNNLDHSQLMQKHSELQAKYSKVKRYYFEQQDQVKTLQNTVASQRMSLSKTSWDDDRYMQKFEQLKDTINNISFNHRKEWRRIPNWLAPVCNRDAWQVGTKEMTAVGRACITKWLFDKIFERVFHPGIDQNLSMHLKTIERGLRRAQYGAHLTNEQQDDLMSKIMTWRLTTIEGLSDVLNSRQAEMYTGNLTILLTRELTDYLRGFMIDTPSPGLSDSLSGIISQALAICSNIPQESRDVCIEYYMPAHHVNEMYMKIESGMTVLQNPGSAPSMDDHVSGYSGQNEDEELTAVPSLDSAGTADIEAQIREATGKGATTNSAGAGNLGPRKESTTASMKSQSITSVQAQQQGKVDSKSKSLFNSFVGKRPTQLSSNPGGLPSQKQVDQQSLATSESGRSDTGNGDAYNIRTLTGDSTDGKIRFAVFLSVEVKGRSVLNVKDDKNDKKDGEKGAESAGVGHSAADSKSADKSGINVLCKAPVYIFDG